MCLEKATKYIEQADEEGINDLLHAVIARYRELFPDWEIHFFSLPKGDREARLRELERIVELIREHGG